MADTEFKSRHITFPEGWKRHSNGGVIDGAKYRPDMSFADEEGQIVCVVESSSTNDRKVGVGELCLADKFFSDNKMDGVLIFSLCGKSQYPPRPDTQARYLEPYFQHLKRGSTCSGVRVVYFIAEDEFAALGWEALTERFKAKAHVLRP